MPLHSALVFYCLGVKISVKDFVVFSEGTLVITNIATFHLVCRREALLNSEVSIRCVHLNKKGAAMPLHSGSVFYCLGVKIRLLCSGLREHLSVVFSEAILFMANIFATIISANKKGAAMPLHSGSVFYCLGVNIKQSCSGLCEHLSVVCSATTLFITNHLGCRHDALLNSATMDWHKVIGKFWILALMMSDDSFISQ